MKVYLINRAWTYHSGECVAVAKSLDAAGDYLEKLKVKVNFTNEIFNKATIDDICAHSYFLCNDCDYSYTITTMNTLD